MFAPESHAQRAFDIAQSLSPTADPAWGEAFSHPKSAELLPKENSGARFPLAILQDWLARAGHPIDVEQAQQLSAALDNAYSELVVRYALRLDLKKSSFERRDRDGVNGALKRALNDITLSARSILAALHSIRGEMLNRRLHGERHLGLEQLHSELHSRFLYGQVRRLDALLPPIGDKSIARLTGYGEVGRRASLAPTWLDEAFEQLAEASEEAVLPPISRMPKSSVYSLSSMKCYFVSQLAKAWVDVTDLPATVAPNDDVLAGRMSAFQIFHQSVCGHASALLIGSRSFPWLDLHQDRARAALKALGLAPILSSTALQRCLSSARNPKTAGKTGT